MYKFLGIKFHNLGYNKVNFIIADTEFEEKIKGDTDLSIGNFTLLNEVIRVYESRKLHVVANLCLAYKNMMRYEENICNGNIETFQEIDEYLQTVYPQYWKDMEKYLLLL